MTALRPTYNELYESYNVARGVGVSNSYVMKVSSNGQVSIPAEARARWHADRLVVVDLGDRIVMRPLPADPVGSLVGKYRRRGPSTDKSRADARAAEQARERRKQA